MTSLSIFNVLKFWLCYHVNLVFNVGIITSTIIIYCTTCHIKSQLPKIISSECYKNSSIVRYSQSAEYLTMSISKTWNGKNIAAFYFVVKTKPHIKCLLQLTKNILNKIENWSSVVCFIKDLVCIFPQYTLLLLVICFIWKWSQDVIFTFYAVLDLSWNR